MAINRIVAVVVIPMKLELCVLYARAHAVLFFVLELCASALVVPCEPRIARVEGTAWPKVSFV